MQGSKSAQKSNVQMPEQLKGASAKHGLLFQIGRPAVSQAVWKCSECL
jgi:hypothetical protein